MLCAGGMQKGWGHGGAPGSAPCAVGVRRAAPRAGLGEERACSPPEHRLGQRGDGPAAPHGTSREGSLLL